MNNLIVRQAVLSDLGTLSTLFDAYRQFYGKTTDLNAAHAFLQARFEHGESVLFIAEINAEAVGFVQLYPSFSSVSLARSFVLNDLFVSYHWRRRGIAKQLIRATISYAKSIGAIRLSLATAENNNQAQALYESTGWLRDSQFHVYHLVL